MKNNRSKEEFEEAIKKSLSIAGVCRELGIRPIGGNYATVKRWINKYGLDTSHFTGQAWNVGSRYRLVVPPKSNEEVFVENSTFSGNKIRKRLLQIREHKCDCCGNTTWNGVEIPLEVHHINGVNTDHRFENLQLLCPNCHALTENYRGRNQKLSALSEMKEVEYRKFKEALTSNVDGNLEPSLQKEKGAETRHGKPKSKRPTIIDEVQVCKYCGKEFHSKRRQNYCSIECYHLMDSKRPNIFDLIESFKKYKSFLQVGKHYGVSDNAVRKWCRLYNILDMVKE